MSEQENKELNLTEVSISSLNSDQTFAFNIVMKTLFDYKNKIETFEPLRLIIAGTAGCGKSFLIKCLVKAIRKFFNTNNCVHVLSTAGSSANLISGVTIHSFLKIPTNKSKELKCPDGNTGRSLQKNCDGLKVILVDERSLVACNTLR